MNNEPRSKAFEFLARAQQLQDSGNLEAAENVLEQALEAFRGSIEVLEAAARFYSTTKRDSAKAAQYASACRDRAAQIVAEMDELLGRRKQPAARHIGGVIGPY